MRSWTRMVDVIEAAYGFEATEEAWLSHLLRATSQAFDHDAGCAGFFYDARRIRKLKVRGIQGALGDPERTMRAIEAFSPDHVRAMFRTNPVGLASDSPVWAAQPAAQMLRAAGIDDLVFVNGVDPSGVGCFIGARAPRKQLSPTAKKVWSRVAAHVAAGYRLQRRLGREAGARLDSANAVLTPGGKIEHVDADAKTDRSRAALRDAVAAMERSRGRLRKDDPEKAVDGWRGLVSARWSLVDTFDVDGRRYVVARSNHTELRGRASLTARERQVVAYARLGHSNKLVAYELGISPSTVGVLLARAAAKLGAKSREAMFAAFDALERERSPDDPDGR